MLGRLYIVALALTLTSAAQAADGLYAGTLECSSAGTSPAFTQSVALAVRNGHGIWSSGQPGQNGFHTAEVVLGSDHAVRIEGHYVVGNDKRPIQLVGSVNGRDLRATGQRGPRTCSLVVSRPPKSGAAPPYRLPYDAVAVRNSTKHRPSFTCPNVVPPQRDLLAEPFYRRDDPTHSILDPDRLSAYNAIVKPLRTFESNVANSANAAIRGDANAEECLTNALDAWARAGAMLGSVTSQGAYERKWSSITYALGFVDAGAERQGSAEQFIARWLRRIGDATTLYYMQPSGSRLSDRANNHAYWAALAAVATGIAAQDSDLFDWGMSRFQAALDDIDADGFLPLELLRGTRALHYHRFALEPLLLLALIARANGVEVDAQRRAALSRLINRVRTGLDDPEPFEERTKIAQEPTGSTRGAWAWAELALAWSGDAALEERIRPLRPFSTPWLGGDLTLRYAR